MRWCTELVYLFEQVVGSGLQHGDGVGVQHLSRQHLQRGHLRGGVPSDAHVHVGFLAISLQLLWHLHRDAHMPRQRRGHLRKQQLSRCIHARDFRHVHCTFVVLRMGNHRIHGMQCQLVSKRAPHARTRKPTDRACSALSLSPDVGSLFCFCALLYLFVLQRHRYSDSFSDVYSRSHDAFSWFSSECDAVRDGGPREPADVQPGCVPHRVGHGRLRVVHRLLWRRHTGAIGTVHADSERRTDRRRIHFVHGNHACLVAAMQHTNLRGWRMGLFGLEHLQFDMR